MEHYKVSKYIKRLICIKVFGKKWIKVIDLLGGQ